MYSATYAAAVDSFWSGMELNCFTIHFTSTLSILCHYTRSSEASVLHRNSPKCIWQLGSEAYSTHPDRLEAPSSEGRKRRVLSVLDSESFCSPCIWLTVSNSDRAFETGKTFIFLFTLMLIPLDLLFVSALQLSKLSVDKRQCHTEMVLLADSYMCCSCYWCWFLLNVCACELAPSLCTPSQHFYMQFQLDLHYCYITVLKLTTFYSNDLNLLNFIFILVCRCKY